MIEQFIVNNMREFIAIISIIAILFFVSFTLKILRQKFKVKHGFVDTLSKYINIGLTSPLILFLFAHLLLSIVITFQILPKEYIKYVDNLQFIIATSGSIWLVIKIISAVESHLSSINTFKQLNINKLLFILKIIIVIITTLFTLNHLGLDLSAVIAFGGVGGLAIGIAAKDLFSNIMGAFFVASGSIFKIGDYISIVDKGFYGTVIDIQWRYTIVTDDNTRPLYIPNSYFTLYTVQNISRMNNRRMNEVITIEYSNHKIIDELLINIRNCLINMNITDDFKEPIVTLRGLGYSHEIGVNCASIELKILVKQTAYGAFQKDRVTIYLAISDVLVKFGCRMLLTNVLEVYTKNLVTSK